MNREQAQARIDTLVAQLNEASYQYYVCEAPVMSDAQYDQLYRELESLERQYPELIPSHAPTKRVGDVLREGFKEVTHRVPMLSLENAMDEDEIRAFDERVLRFLRESGSAVPSQLEYSLEHKFDGVAMSLVYQRGVLAYAVTRGDGAVGEDVTENVRTIATVPLRVRAVRDPALAAALADTFEVRGEVVFPKKAFAAVNEQRVAQGEAPFANPRNAASGSLRQLDPAVTAQRPLEFYAYALLGSPSLEEQLGTHFQALQVVKELGFKVTADVRVVTSVAQVLEEYRSRIAIRDSLPFDVDGMVVKVNERTLQQQLGFRERSPRWAIAAKFPPVEAVTILKDITVQVGRTGALTPVAELEPVSVGGVVVARATLHNMQDIARKGVKIGDVVTVRRQGDVIPAVVAPMVHMRKGHERDFVMPTTCPVCGAAVIQEQDLVVVRCGNSECPAQIEERIRHFASRDAANIEGLGEKNISLLRQYQLLPSIPALFELTEQQLAALPRFGDLSAKKLIKNIHAAKNLSLAKFLFALGIEHVGEKTAKVIARGCGTLAKVRAATVEQLQSLPEIGAEIARSVVDFFAPGSSGGRLVTGLLAQGMVVQEEQVDGDTSAGALAGKTVVLTGTLPTLSRAEAQRLLEEAGAKVTSSVSKATSFVVAGAEVGSKLSRAQELGIEVIDEAELLVRVGRG